jgi:cell division septal protein FtsQ
MIKIIKRKKNNSNSELQKKQKIFSGRWIFHLTGVIFLITVLFVLFFSDLLLVNEVKISGLDRLEEAPIRDISNQKIEGKYFNFMKKNNLILFPQNSLEQELLEKFKRIQTVSIKKHFPDIVELAIEERKFVMLLCESEKCYLLNEEGMPYPAENFTQEELAQEDLPVLRDLSGARIDDENAPLKEDFQKFAVELGERVWEDVGIRLKQSYETPSRMSGDLKAETEAGWKIYFSEEAGMEREILMLRVVLEQKIEKERQKDLEYIDLRIANKVFYKFKEGTEQAQEVDDVPVSETKKKKDRKED